MHLAHALTILPVSFIVTTPNRFLPMFLWSTYYLTTYILRLHISPVLNTGTSYYPHYVMVLNPFANVNDFVRSDVEFGFGRKAFPAIPDLA